MGSQLSKRKSPEENELEKKQQELAQLTEELAEQELERATLRRALTAFEIEYMCTVGLRYAEFDAIEAEIALWLSQSQPENDGLREEADRAQRKATESAEAADASQTADAVASSPPTDELKNLYKSVARAVHPDHAVDEDDRVKREELMAQVNEASDQGDASRIQEILEEWESSPEAIKGDSIGDDLVRMIRHIEQVKNRIKRVEEEITELKGSTLAQLKEARDVASTEGRDLLAELTEKVGFDIREAQARLEALKGAD